MVTLRKTKKDRGLGLTISGGVDRGTTYPSVSHLRSGGVAERSECLVIEDTILSVNGQTMVNLTHEEIANILRNAGQIVKIQLCYTLPLNLLNSNGKIAVKRTALVCINKEGQNFGFVIRESTSVDRNGWCPIMVASIRPGSALERDGSIQIGDVILAVNGQSLSGASRRAAVQLFDQASLQLSLKIQYDSKTQEPIKTSSGSWFVDLEKPSAATSLGLSLEVSTDFGQTCLVISHIKEASVADRCGVLHVGDQLLMIDNTIITGLLLAEAVEILSNTGQQLRLEILPLDTLQLRDLESLSDGTSDQISTNNPSLDQQKYIRNSPRNIFSNPSNTNPAVAWYMRKHDRVSEKPGFAKRLDFSYQTPEAILEKQCVYPHVSETLARNVRSATLGSDNSAPARIRSSTRNNDGLTLADFPFGVKTSLEHDDKGIDRSIDSRQSQRNQRGRLQGTVSSPNTLDREVYGGYACAGRQSTLDRHLLTLPGNLRSRTYDMGSPQSSVSISSSLSCCQSQVTHVETLDVVLSKSEEHDVFGLCMDERIFDGIWPVFVITDIQYGSIGHSCGLLQVNDRLVAINGESICSMNLEDIDYLLLNNTSITLTVDFDVSDAVTPASGKFNVKLLKINKNLGITIEATNETQDSPYKITNIVKGSLAYRNGALAVGDYLLSVNGCSLIGCNLTQVQRLLDESQVMIILTVLKTKTEPDSLTYTVELSKHDGHVLGITCSQENKVVVISSLSHDSIAQRSGAVHVGDQIVAVNGLDTEKMTAQELNELLKSILSQVIRLKIKRLRKTTQSGVTNTTSQDLSNKRYDKQQGRKNIPCGLVSNPFTLKRTSEGTGTLKRGTVAKTSLIGFNTLLHKVEKVSCELNMHHHNDELNVAVTTDQYSDKDCAQQHSDSDSDNVVTNKCSKETRDLTDTDLESKLERLLLSLDAESNSEGSSQTNCQGERDCTEKVMQDTDCKQKQLITEWFEVTKRAEEDYDLENELERLLSLLDAQTSPEDFSSNKNAHTECYEVKRDLNDAGSDLEHKLERFISSMDAQRDPEVVSHSKDEPTEDCYQVKRNVTEEDSDLENKLERLLNSLDAKTNPAIVSFDKDKPTAVIQQHSSEHDEKHFPHVHKTVKPDHKGTPYPSALQHHYAQTSELDTSEESFGDNSVGIFKSMETGLLENQYDNIHPELLTEQLKTNGLTQESDVETTRNLMHKTMKNDRNVLICDSTKDGSVKPQNIAQAEMKCKPKSHVEQSSNAILDNNNFTNNTSRDKCHDNHSTARSSYRNYKFQDFSEQELTPDSGISTSFSSKVSEQFQHSKLLEQLSSNTPKNLHCPDSSGQHFSFSTPLDMSVIKSLDWEVHCIVLQKGRDNRGFGFRLADGRVNGGLSTVHVGTLRPSGMSVFSGELKSGDMLLEVNGVDVQQQSLSEVESLIKTSGNHLYLIICRNPFDNMQDSSV